MGHLNKKIGVKYLVLCLDCFRSWRILLGNLRESREQKRTAVATLTVTGLNYLLGLPTSPCENSSLASCMFFQTA